MKFLALDVELARRFKFVRGILLMLAIVALWGIPALIQTHGEFLRIGIGRHVIGRSIGAMEGHGSNSLGTYLLLLPFYFVTVFASFFPWSLKLPALTKKLWRERDQTDLYLLSGVAIIFVIFTLIKTKLPHYTLPAFPLLALLVARHVSTERFVKTAAIAVGCHLSRGRAIRRALRCPILSGSGTLSTSASRSQTGDGIWRDRVPGTESRLVFSIARERLDGSVKGKKRDRIHAKKWAAFCHFAN